MEKSQRQVLEDAKRVGVYKYREEPFQLSGGGISNHYFNVRELTMNRETMGNVGFAIFNLMKHLDYTCVAGLSSGADPIIFSLAYLFKLTPIQIRKEEKKHGMQTKIEKCSLSGKQNVLIVDDVITTGHSVVEAFTTLMECQSVNFDVVGIAVVVDREESGAEYIERCTGIRPLSVLHKGDFL